MRRRKQDKSVNYLRLMCVTIFFSVLFLSIGWAAFQSTFNISNLLATVRIDKDIRVTNVQSSTTANSGRSNYEEYNVSSIYSTLYLPNANSTVTFTVEVTNVGNVMQGIYDIEEIYKIINTDTNSNLEIKNTTLVLKEALCDDQNSSLCKLGSVSTFNITVGYKNNGYDGTNLTHLVTLNFDFRRVYGIAYNGFSNTSGLPTQMMYGDTKVITFNNTTGIPGNVVVAGATGSYSSPTLTLSNITIQNTQDSIVVTRGYSVSYVGFAGNTSGLPSGMTTSGGTITFNNTSGIPTNVIVTGATYSYSNPPNLVLSNLTSNVVVSNAYPVTYVSFTGSTSGLPSAIAVTGGTITFNNTSGIPASVTVTGATADYNNPPNLVLSNITGSVTITATFNGNVEVIDNGDGTTTTNTSVVAENPDGSTTTTINSVTTDSQGNVTSTSETETTENTNGTVVSTTTNYDAQGNPTSGSTSNTDTHGNTNTQEVEYTSNGDSYVSGYTIDTSGNSSGGEVVASLDTGMIVFDGKGFEMTLVFKCNLSQNVGNNIFGAIQSVNNKYAGFNLAIPSSAKVNMYAGKNSSLYSSGAIGSNIHSNGQYWSISSANNSKVTEYTLTMTYLPKNYGTNTNTKYGYVSVSLTPVQTSGSNYYQQNPFEKVSANIPEDLENATFTLGGNGINSNYDMTGFEVISFEVHKI